jgi:hypothetical protein
MEWNTTWEDPLTSYVKHFDGLIGDQREMLATLSNYATAHQGLPSKIAAFLHGWQPPGDL